MCFAGMRMFYVPGNTYFQTHSTAYTYARGAGVGEIVVNFLVTCGKKGRESAFVLKQYKKRTRYVTRHFRHK
jgi:hypothetical protein